jgi:hypothetical protein
LENDRELEVGQRAVQWRERGQLELVTALRRRQGRPDPISIEVLRGSDLVVDAPALPRLVLRIRNRDTVPVGVRNTINWFWRVRGRTMEGAPLPQDRDLSLGYSDSSSVRRLDPGETTLLDLPLDDYLQPFTGKAELQITFCNHRRIWEELESLEGVFLFHPEVVRVDVRTPSDSPARRTLGADLWPVVANDARIRELAREAGVPLLETDHVLLVANDDCPRFLDVLDQHDVLLERVEAWVREHVGARREAGGDERFAKPGFGTDPGDGARSILAARLWFWRGRGGVPRYAFHLREHTGR